MGVAIRLVQLDDATIDELLTTPSMVEHFLFQEPLAVPRPLSKLAEFFGAQPAEPAPVCSATRFDGDETDVDKAWDALDFLFSEGRTKVGICRFLTQGGDTIEHDICCSKPRAFRAKQVSEIWQFLREMHEAILRKYYLPDKMAGIYPRIWKRDGDKGFDYIFRHFSRLKPFIETAAKTGRGVLISE